MTLYTIFYAASKFIGVIYWAILIYCILTWVAPRSAARYWLERFISPICAPFRRLSRYICMRWGSPFDLTCFFAIIALNLVQRLMWNVYYFLAYSF